ncbi:hypothetical protein MASR2M15_04970 [Anaerolineales bacterium]
MSTKSISNPEDASQQKVSDLTVEELKQIIRETVQSSVAEVMIEFALASRIDEQLLLDAEMADYLRDTLHRRGHSSTMPPLDWDD